MLAGGRRVGHVTVQTPARLAITALVTFASTMPADTHAHIEVGLFAARKPVDQRGTDVPGQNGSGTQLALQGVVSIPSGSTSIELGSIARWYSSPLSGEAKVESVSIIATVLPPS